MVTGVVTGGATGEVCLRIIECRGEKPRHFFKGESMEEIIREVIWNNVYAQVNKQFSRDLGAIVWPNMWSPIHHHIKLAVRNEVY